MRLRTVSTSVHTMPREITHTPVIRVTELRNLQHIERASGTSACVADIPVTAAGVLQFPPLLFAGVHGLSPNTATPRQRQQGIEILTVMLRGRVSHVDTVQGRRLVGADDITLLSSGSGAEHEETALYAVEPEAPPGMRWSELALGTQTQRPPPNPDRDARADYLVFWLRSRSPLRAPRYDVRTIARTERLNFLRLVAAPSPRSHEVLDLDADATLHTGVLVVGTEVTHHVKRGRGAYLLSTIGRVQVGDLTVAPGDRVRVGSGTVRIRALESTEVVVLTA